MSTLQVWLANILRTHFFWGTYLKLHQSNPQPFAINSYRCCCRCQPEACSESNSGAEWREIARLRAAPRDRVVWRLTFSVSKRPFRRKKGSLQLSAAIPVTRHSMDNFSTHLLLRFLLILLFLFYQSYKNLKKITTNILFSFPQVQVINSSQKPS